MSYQLKPFVEMVALSDKKIRKELAPSRAALAQKRAEFKMAEIDARIATLEQNIVEAATEPEIDFDHMADHIDEIELLRLRKERFLEIVGQLFP
jgi:predicted secreted Zn-dependent protease